MSHCTTSLTAALAFLLAPLASAQPVAAQETREPDPDSVIAVAPLEVKILRSGQPSARAPYAVAGLGSRQLTAARPGAFLTDALTALPGLQLQNRYNFAVGERIAVRGFGSRSQFGVRGLRIYLDGVPATLPDGQATTDHVDAGALGRVELLRGPASALYGNGAGGVLLMESRRPEPGRRLQLGSHLGSFGLLETRVAAEDADERQQTRVQLTRMEFDGFRTNPIDGGTYGAAERWILTGKHERELAGGRLAVVTAGVELDAENPGSLPAASLGDDDRPAWGFNVIQGTGKEVRQLQLGLTWNRELGSGGTDLNSAVWGLARELTNPIPTSVIDVRRAGFGARVGLGGGGAALRWDVGLELEAQRDDRKNYGNDGGDIGELTLAQDEAVTGLGLFAAVAANRGPADIHAALRLDRIAFSVEDQLVLLDGLDESGDRTLSALSPSVGGQLELGPVSVFGSFATFLQTPTTTELANRPTGAGGFNPELDPTRGWTLEGGVRGKLGRWAGWEILGFLTDLTDELIPFEVPTDPGRTFFRNAGESRYQGAEAALRVAPGRGFQGRVAYTLVDARFQGGELDDNRIPGRAPGLLEAVVEQTLGNAFWSVDLRWSDDVPADDENTSEAQAYALLGLRAGVRSLALGSASLSPWVAVRNLLDEDYVSSVAVNAFGSRYFEPGPPRALQVGLTVTLER